MAGKMLWLLLLSSAYVTTVLGQDAADARISMVIDPLTWIDSRWFMAPDPTRGSMLLQEDPLFNEFQGSSTRIGAIRENFDFSAPLPDQHFLLIPEDEDPAPPSWGANFGWILEDRPYSCHGADTLSFWYRYWGSGTNSTSILHLTLYDDYDCEESEGHSCSDPENLKAYRISTFPVDSTPIRVWYEISVPMNATPGMHWDHIRGWRFDYSTELQVSSLRLQQLACYGSADKMLETPFVSAPSYEQAVEEGVWEETFFQSEISEQDTKRIIDPEENSMYLDYAVEQVEPWGGYLSVSHRSPGNSYYNLSGANHLLLDYEVSEPASIPDRLTFRLILEDNSDCLHNCDVGTSNEHWYSFQPILNEINENGTVVVPFIGSSSASTPLWFTGTSGKRGNAQFDSEYIKGITFELGLDNGLDIGQIVEGAITLSNLRAIQAPFEDDAADSLCVTEPAVFIDVDKYAEHYEGFQFLSRDCCNLCHKDPDCLFAIQDYDGDCSTGSALVPDSVELLTQPAGFRRNEFTLSYVDDPVKRGDFCSKCDCRPDEQVIDCRGRDLRILPKTFDGDFVPLVLDVRENPQMALLGSLDQAIQESVRILRLPSNLRHLPQEFLDGMPQLQTLEFENVQEGDWLGISNVIASDSEPFGNVCCQQHATQLVVIGNRALSFCDLQILTAGADSMYFPFVKLEGTQGLTIYPSSDSFFEAAESVESCADYCTISSFCQFFAYDGRVSNAEASCSLIASPDPVSEEVCCQPSHFADESQTVPGWISGVPPRTRHSTFNASVQFKFLGGLTLEETNEYSTEYEVSLGAMPALGAVWVEPQVVSGGQFDTTISPSTVVLYDNETVVTVSIKVAGLTTGSTGGTLVIKNNIESCDTAFTSFEVGTDNSIFLNVVPPPAEVGSSQRPLILGIALSLSMAALLLAGIVYNRGRKTDDAVWKIHRKDIEFEDPPQIVGRGTFGLVLLGNYRGTKVAVKRVIPPQEPTKKKRKNNFAFMSMGRDSFGSMGSASSEEDDIATDPLNMSGSDPDVENLKMPTLGTMSGIDVDLKMSGNADLTSSTASRSKSSKASGSVSTLKSFKNIGQSMSMNATYASRLTSMIGTRANAAQQHKQMKKEFIKEMKILARLRHPCITTVMGAVIEKGSEPMLVMEYMEHGSFYDILHNSTMPMGPDVVLPILTDIIAGIQFLHLADPPVLHGDLKAANILVDDKFRAKVSDFGLSSKKNLGGTGTPYWMAPELLRKESTNTEKTDLYSFGMIIYEAFSRKEPYEGEDPQEVLQQVADQTISKRPPFPSSCSLQIESIMADCLEDNPSLRPSATELTTRLQRVKIEEDDKNTPTLSLFDIFPRHVAEALRDGRKVESEHKECVTIFFSDIVGFTNISSTLEPRKIADLLDRLYSIFDELSHQFDIFKVETIGDAYMAVTNLVKEQPDTHARRIAEFAMAAIQAANQTLIDKDDPGRGCVNIRVGFHSGPVVADVVGNRNPRYCLFGDTVNTASRMESNSQVNRIHCSERSAELLKVQYPELLLKSRGQVPIKGKGVMHTYWVNDNGRKGEVARIKPENEMAKIVEVDMDGTEAEDESAAALEEAHPDSHHRRSPKKSSNSSVSSASRAGAKFAGDDWNTVEERLNARLARNRGAPMRD